jgi:ribosomal protein S18 acetylase RimI-like enzyme
MSSLTFKSADTLSLERLAEAFNAAFAGYFYPQNLTGETFARRARLEQLDLHHSLLAYVGEEYAGVSLLGIRGGEGWCGGFGIVPEFRGRGLARELMQEFASEARRCNLQRLKLEVLARNTAARHLYESAGMSVTRDLLILERARTAETSAQMTKLAEAAPERLLRHFTRLHACPPAWQRDLPSLLTTDGTRGFYLGEPDAPRAYAVLVSKAEGSAHLIDLAADDEAAARELCAGLCEQPHTLRSVNEPEDGLFASLLIAHGFDEKDRQHEMACEL